MPSTITRTNVRLLTSVPFNVDYEHTRWFTSRTQQSDYFANRRSVFQTATANFQRVEGRYSFKCPLNIEDLRTVNYITFQNQNGKQFYGFVTSKEYYNSKVTDVTFVLDALQTYMFDMRFRDSFMEREHQREYNDGIGMPNINSLEEGLDYGNEYKTTGIEHIANPDGVRFVVIVSKQHVIRADDDDEVVDGTVQRPSTFNGMYQPLYYYFVPVSRNGESTRVNKSQGGSTYHSFPNLGSLMSVLYESEENVNNIVSIYVTEDIGVPFTTTRDTETGYVEVTFQGALESETHEFEYTEGDQFAMMYVRRIDQTITTEFTIENFREKFYDGYGKPDTSKVLAFPYSVIELNDFKGNVVTLKPDFVNSPDLTIIRKGSLGTDNKVSYAVKNYSMSNDDFSGKLQAQNVHALIDNNPNDLPILNDHLASFMQGNKNQINNQKEQMATQLMMGMAQGLTGGIVGARSTTGSPMSAVGSAFNATNAIADYHYGIQGILTKQQDINNIPPSVQKMGGNTAYDFSNGYTGMFVVFKTVQPQYRHILEDYFKLYGYKQHRLKQPNFRTKTNFNYVKTKNALITGNFENQYITQLKEIFNSGITLWHNNSIGDYSVTNHDISGGG